MTTEVKKPLKLFYCYAREDKALRDELDIHLSSLKRQNIVSSWYDGAINPGSDWEKEIDTHLREAHIILLLITPHFMASDYCYSVEMQRALQRDKDGTARVIPIILRRTFWDGAPFSHLQFLPIDAKPVTQWVDRDEAFWDITVGIHKTITELRSLLKTAQEWFGKGNALHDLKRYEDAILAYDQAIRLDLNDANAYYNKGNALLNLKRYDNAILAFDQAIRLDPNYALAYIGKGIALRNLKRYEDAIVAYDHAIRLDPNYATAYQNKGIALDYLKRSKEAQQCYQMAKQLGYEG